MARKTPHQRAAKTPSDDELILMTEPELAKKFRRTPNAMRKLRLSGGAPPFVRLGRRVHYRKSDVLRFLQRKAASSQSGIK